MEMIFCKGLSHIIKYYDSPEDKMENVQNMKIKSHARALKKKKKMLHVHQLKKE